MTSKEYREQFFFIQDFLYCESCGRSDFYNGSAVHHIISRALAPRHENLHHKKNLILVCGCDHTVSGCHKELSQREEAFEKLIKERKLWELFPALEFLKKFI